MSTAEEIEAEKYQVDRRILRCVVIYAVALMAAGTFAAAVSFVHVGVCLSDNIVAQLCSDSFWLGRPIGLGLYQCDSDWAHIPAIYALCKHPDNAVCNVAGSLFRAIGHLTRKTHVYAPLFFVFCLISLVFWAGMKRSV